MSTESAAEMGAPPVLREMWRTILSPSPQVAYGFRFAFCVCLAIALGHHPALITNEAKWILITVLVVSSPDSAGSLIKGATRILGTVAAAFTAIGLFGLFSQDPPLLCATLFAVTVAGAYGFTGPRVPYAWFCFAFTTAVILGGTMGGGATIETVAFQRATLVSLGVMIIVLGDALLWPRRTELSARTGLAARARSIGSLLRSAILVPEKNPPTTVGLAEQLNQIAAASAEVGVTPLRIQAMQRIAIALEAAQSRVRVIDSLEPIAIHPEERDEELSASFQRLASGIEEAFEPVALALEAGDASPEHIATLEAALRRTKLALEELRGNAAQFVDAGPYLDALTDLVRVLESVHEGFDALASSSSPATASAPEDPPARGRIWTKADPFRMQLGLRTAIAVCVALLVPVCLGWGANAAVAPIAMLVACTPTRGAIAKTVPLLVFVFVGGWALADVAIVFGNSEIGRLPTALVPVVIFCGLLGYATAGKPQLAAVRTVASVMALLPYFGGQAPPTNVYGSYTMLCYIGVALAVGTVSALVLWAHSASDLFRMRAAGQLELCSALIRDLSRSRGEEARGKRAEALGGFAVQMAGIAALHAQADYEGDAPSLDGARRAELLVSIQQLFDACLSLRPGEAPEEAEGLAAAAARLERGALCLRSGEAAPPPAAAEAPASDARDAEGSHLLDRVDAIENWLRDWSAARAS